MDSIILKPQISGLVSCLKFDKLKTKWRLGNRLLSAISMLLDVVSKFSKNARSICVEKPVVFTILVQLLLQMVVFSCTNANMLLFSIHCSLRTFQCDDWNTMWRKQSILRCTKVPDNHRPKHCNSSNHQKGPEDFEQKWMRYMKDYD